jgi:hypothetical protein
MLEWLKWGAKITGLNSFTGTGTIILGLGVAMGAAASWLREDAKTACDAAWTLTLQSETEKLQKSELAKSKQIQALELKLAAKETEASVAAESAAHLMENQRDKIPLSDACNACRVPNARLWLRDESAPAVKAGKQSKPGT